MTILQPPAVLLEGAPGAGKTDSLATFIEAGLDLFVISTEPDGVGSLLDSVRRRKLDINRLHYTSVQPATSGWTALNDMARTIGAMGFEQIQNIKAGVGKEETRKPAMKLLETFANFRCERTGKLYGDVASWDASRALALDSLSGLSIMSMALTIGYKPAAHQGEWGVAMNFIEQLLLTLTSNRGCFFALTAHVEKELNEMTGTAQIMASTLGRKLAPKVPRFFSEVVYAKRTLRDNKAHFSWSTVDNNADLKSRGLAMSADLVPSFVPVVESYRERLRIAVAEPQATAQQVASGIPKAIIPQTGPMTRPQPVVASTIGNSK